MSENGTATDLSTALTPEAFEQFTGAVRQLAEEMGQLNVEDRAAGLNVPQEQSRRVAAQRAADIAFNNYVKVADLPPDGQTAMLLELGVSPDQIDWATKAIGLVKPLVGSSQLPPADTAKLAGKWFGDRTLIFLQRHDRS
jgi:hypothetical protein